VKLIGTNKLVMRVLVVCNLAVTSHFYTIFLLNLKKRRQLKFSIIIFFLCQIFERNGCLCFFETCLEIVDLYVAHPHKKFENCSISQL
jgi:hypothetical protein